MVSSKNGNGEKVPRWFKAFDEKFSQRMDGISDRLDDTAHAIKILAENDQHLVTELRDLAAKFHESQLETNSRLERLEKAQVRTTQELTRTRHQSAKLFSRLIVEVKALRHRP